MGLLYAGNDFTYSNNDYVATGIQITSITEIVPGDPVMLALDGDIGATTGVVVISADGFTVTLDVTEWDAATSTITATGSRIGTDRLRYGDVTVTVTLDDGQTATTTGQLVPPAGTFFADIVSANTTDENALLKDAVSPPAGEAQFIYTDPAEVEPVIDESGVVTSIAQAGDISGFWWDAADGTDSATVTYTLPLAEPQGITTLGAAVVDGSTSTLPVSYDLEDQTGYEYELDGAAAVAFGTDTTTELVLTELADGSYSVRVRAVNDAGPGAWSDPQAFTVDAAVVEPEPEPEPQALGYLTAERIDLFPGTGRATVFTGTDMIAKLVGLKDEHGTPVDDADISISLYKRGSKEPINGQTWPLSMTPAGEGGYTAGMSRALEVTPGNQLSVTVVATYSGRQATFVKHVRAAKQVLR